MKLKIPKKFAERVEIQDHLETKFNFKTIIQWMIDSEFRTKVNLTRWIRKQELSDAMWKNCLMENQSGVDTNKEKMQLCLDYVKRYIKYVSDKESWKMLDKWQTPKETEERKTGDCEDGALLIYKMATAMGVPDRQLKIVCGNVFSPQAKNKRSGHAYVVWLSDEDGLEYPIDWCYFTDATQITPYVMRTDYFCGEEEWFRFNDSGMYRLR